MIPGTEAVERALQRRRVVAWSLSLFTLALTVAFFAMMTLAGPLLARVVLGQYITLANVLAVGMIAVFLVTIAIYGAFAARADALLAGSTGSHDSTPRNRA